MKRAVLVVSILVSLLIAPLTSSAIRWENGRLTTDYSVDTYYESVYGNVDRSVLDVDRTTKDNWHYNERLKVNLEQKITDDANLEFFFYGRHTTDRQIQDERAKILQMYLRLYGENYEFAVGDVSEYYTKYSFNNTFLGARAWVKPFSMLKVMILGGRNREGADDTFEHTFGGVRVEYTPRPNYLFGTTYIHTEITKLFPDSSYLDYANDLVSFDTRLRLFNRKLLIRGETAFSWYEEDRRNPQADRPEGWAINVEMDYRPIRTLKLSLDYEYVEPNFVTIMGSAAVDRETIKGEVRWTPSDGFELWGKYRFVGDRLSESSTAPYRTETNYSEAGFIYKPFYDDKESYFRNLKVDVRLDYTRSMSRDDPHSVDDERFDTRVIVSNSYKRMRYSLEYGLRHSDSFVTGTSDSMTNTFGAKWGYAFSALGLDWDLALGYRVDFRNTYDSSGALYDTISSVNTGMSVRYVPTKTRLSLSYLGVFSRIDDGYDTEKNSTEVALEQILYENENVTSILGVSYRNLDFFSDNHEDTYGENIYMLSLTLRF